MLRRGDVRGKDRGQSRILGRLLGGFSRREDSAALSEHQEAVTIAISSGKGGTGKSFLATSLSILLDHPHGGPRFAKGESQRPREHRRVALVDCDFGLACDHLLLGVKPEKTLLHVVSGGAPIEEIELETEYGPTLIPGGSGIQSMASLGRSELGVLGSELGRLATRNDAVLLDTGAGISPQTVLPLVCADHVVLVTQPEIAALTDAYAMIKSLASQCRHSPFSIVVNRVAEPGQGDRTFQKLAEVARRFTSVELHYLGEILEDPAVTQRRLGQPPLVISDPKCATARSIQVIQDRLRAVVGSFRARKVPPDVGLTARFHGALARMP